MGKHAKEENLNDKPFDTTLSPAEKAREFDVQYGQNRTYTNTPELDNKEKNK